MSVPGRVRAAGERAVRAAKARIAAAAGDVPGVSAEVVEDGVALSGRGLVKRMLHDPTLQMRWWA